MIGGPTQFSISQEEGQGASYKSAFLLNHLCWKIIHPYPNAANPIAQTPGTKNLAALPHWGKKKSFTHSLLQGN